MTVNSGLASVMVFARRPSLFGSLKTTSMCPSWLNSLRSTTAPLKGSMRSAVRNSGAGAPGATPPSKPKMLKPLTRKLWRRKPSTPPTRKLALPWIEKSAGSGVMPSLGSSSIPNSPSPSMSTATDAPEMAKLRVPFGCLRMSRLPPTRSRPPTTMAMSAENSRTGAEVGKLSRMGSPSEPGMNISRVMA